MTSEIVPRHPTAVAVDAGAVDGFASAVHCVLAALLALFVLASSAGAAPLEMTCETGQPPIEPCFRIHARLYATNGFPVRLWPVGTKRHLAVDNLDSLHPLIERYLGFDSKIYGDFEVCPLSEDRPGHMRSVCLRSAEKLVVERGSGDEREVFRLLPTWEPAAAEGTVADQPQRLSALGRSRHEGGSDNDEL